MNPKIGSFKSLCGLLATVSFLHLSGVAQAQEAVTDPELKVGHIPADQREKIKSRVESLNLRTLGFGPATMSGTGNTKVFYAVNYGYSWDVSEQGEIRAGLYGAFPSEGQGYFTSAGIGGSFFFSSTNVSPILGGEFGFGTVKSGDLTYGGFAYEVHGGVRFFRTSNTQLSIEAYHRGVMKTDAPNFSGLNLNIHF